MKCGDLFVLFLFCSVSIANGLIPFPKLSGDDYDPHLIVFKLSKYGDYDENGCKIRLAYKLYTVIRCDHDITENDWLQFNEKLTIEKAGPIPKDLDGGFYFPDVLLVGMPSNSQEIVAEIEMLSNSKMTKNLDDGLYTFEIISHENVFDVTDLIKEKLVGKIDYVQPNYIYPNALC